MSNGILSIALKVEVELHNGIKVGKYLADAIEELHCAVQVCQEPNKY
jgi:hypothetical protein